MPGVGLLGGIRGQQAGTVGVAPPDGGAKGVEQVFELLVQAGGVGGKVQQCVALLGQLLGQAGDVARQLAVLGVVELGDATVGGAAARRQAKAQTLGYLADGWVVGAKDGDPARAVPARHALVVHVGGRVALAGRHGMERRRFGLGRRRRRKTSAGGRRRLERHGQTQTRFVGVCVSS